MLVWVHNTLIVTEGITRCEPRHSKATIMNTKQEITALISALSLSQDSLMEKAQKLGGNAHTLYCKAQDLILSLRDVSFSEDGETTSTLNDLIRLSATVDKSIDLLQEIAAA